MVDSLHLPLFPLYIKKKKQEKSKTSEQKVNKSQMKNGKSCNARPREMITLSKVKHQENRNL